MTAPTAAAGLVAASAEAQQAVAPTSLASTALGFYALLSALADDAASTTARMWDELDFGRLLGSWLDLRMPDRLLLSTAVAQQAAAATAARYVEQAVELQGGTPAGREHLPPTVFAGVASDGRDLDALLRSPLIQASTALTAGEDVNRAALRGRTALRQIVTTQVQDTGRSATQVAMAAEPNVTEYVRMLTPPSCSRCALLAGRRYKTNAGFDRHPLCNCIAVPAVEDAADDLRTDPDAYFRSLTREQQNRYFTVAGAEAIRNGADISQVVNARRGASGLSSPGRLTRDEQRIIRGGQKGTRLQRVDVYGRQLEVTSEGTTRRGVAGKRLIAASGSTRGSTRYRRAKTPRLMPEAILQVAGQDTDEQVRLLRRFGYLL